MESKVVVAHKASCSNGSEPDTPEKGSKYSFTPLQKQLRSNDRSAGKVAVSRLAELGGSGH
jgi:hypothetical protein